MERIIVTGFDAFGKHSLNPTEFAMNHLKNLYSKEQVITLVLPTSYKRSWESLKAAIDDHHPKKVIMFGLAHKADDFVFEKIAINHQSATIADNDDVLIKNSKIVEGGEDGIFTTLPIKQYIEHCGGRISLSAGSFVCNSLMYNCLRYTKKMGIEAGFIHVPGESRNQSDINMFAEKVINFAISK